MTDEAFEPGDKLAKFFHRAASSCAAKQLSFALAINPSWVGCARRAVGDKRTVTCKSER
jgi:hypothetical protein